MIYESVHSREKTMHDSPLTERQALELFKVRMLHIESEVKEIDLELARRDVIALAHRTRAAIRLTRTLLDKNVDILFSGQPAQFHEDLYHHLEWAEDHVARALSDEIDFEAMEKRLYLATRLAEDVLKHVSGALGAMERQLDEKEHAEGRRPGGRLGTVPTEGVTDGG